MSKKDLYILGISSNFHDSAATLLKNGEIVAAAQEERFSRVKHDPSFPENAIKYCLKEAGIKGKDLDYVGYYENPFLKFERLMVNYAENFPKSYKQFKKAIPSWLAKKLWVKSTIRNFLDYDGKIIFIPHHLSHAASAFFCSGFKDSAILTIDGVGEWDTTVLGYGKGNKIELLKHIVYPHSIGLLYSAVTYYLGFKVNSAEYKVMGLAPYGNVSFREKFDELINVNDDGSFALNTDCFSYEYDTVMITNKFSELFGRDPRKPEGKLEQFHFDIAKTLQDVTEKVILKMASHAKELTKSKNLAMAGGVALNCVANGKLLRSGLFENIFIQPAAGDAGGSLGVALYINTQILKNKPHKLDTLYFGPGYDNKYIEKLLKKEGVAYKKLSDREVIINTAREIKNKNVVGWFQGKMEFGPRALGNRCILADPSDPKMQGMVNRKIKFRESFRPFAPTVLEEDIQKYFELNIPTPYMLLVADTINGKEKFPAVTHVDNSARIQSINRKQNPKYYDLIREFKRLSGLGMVLNTSFNVRGEPIVRSPQEALACFFGTNMDILVLGSFMISKKDNEDKIFDPEIWKTKFEAD